MKPVFCASLILCAPLTWADPALPDPWVTKNPVKTVTVDYLYETCAAKGATARGMIPYFDCEAYVYGVLDAYRALRPSIPKRQRACLPPALPPWQALEDLRYLQDKAGTQNAAQALLAELPKKYPCK